MALADFRQWFSFQYNVVPGVPGSNKDGGSIYVEEFAIPQARVGSAIGPKGSNIKAARSIEGIEQINSTNRFLTKDKIVLFQVCIHCLSHITEPLAIHYCLQITASTPEAAKEAREILEHNRLTMKVPREMVGRVIGAQGSKIQVNFYLPSNVSPFIPHILIFRQSSTSPVSTE